MSESCVPFQVALTEAVQAVVCLGFPFTGINGAFVFFASVSHFVYLSAGKEEMLVIKCLLNLSVTVQSP